MKILATLSIVVLTLVSGCYIYEYSYYEPQPYYLQEREITYVESPTRVYIHSEPSVIYVRDYDPWYYWRTPAPLHVWCGYCSCYHSQHHNCPRYQRYYPATHYEPSKTYYRDSSGRYHYNTSAPTSYGTAGTERRERTHVPRVLR